MNNNAENCKVVLIGESGVGKTSIISRFVHEKFDNQFMSTLGASFASKSLFYDDFDKMVKFEIWDTAGQEKYRSLTKIFYKDAQIAIIVYDNTRKVTFEEVKNFWINEVKENSNKNIKLILAGNKSDMFEFSEVDETEARNLAKEHNAVYKLVSAKSGTGIGDLYDTAGRMILDKSFKDDSSSLRLNSRTHIQAGLKKAEKKGCC